MSSSLPKRDAPRNGIKRAEPFETSSLLRLPRLKVDIGDYPSPKPLKEAVKSPVGNDEVDESLQL